MTTKKYSCDINEEIGKKYGHWTILEKSDCPMKGKVKPLYFKCQCDCGVVKDVRFVDMRNGRSSQCRDCRDKEVNIDIESMVGRTIGKWFIEGLADKKVNKRLLVCRCECGKTSIKLASILKLGKSLSCHLCNVTKHGYESSRTYTSWRSMKRRCTSKKNDNYENYGGRGIVFCDRWSKFENFLEDMGERPEGLEIDRINNDGNYEPGNCRWVNKSQNASNRRKRK